MTRTTREVHFFSKVEEGEEKYFTLVADAMSKKIVRSAWRTPGVDNGKDLEQVIQHYESEGYKHEFIDRV